MKEIVLKLCEFDELSKDSNQYEDQLYYENGNVYVEPLNEIV